jgi:hypothetical protein
MALVAAGIGWFRRRLWGWKLAVAIIAIQVAGDVINCIRGDWVRGGIGVVIAGVTLAVPFASYGQKRFCLKSFSEEFETDVTNQGGYHGDLKIRRGEDICHRPGQPLLLPQT